MRIKVGQVFDRLTVVAFVRYGKNSAGFWPRSARTRAGPARPGPLAIMPSADQVPVKTSHSTMHWHMWVVLIAGSTGSALRAVRPPNLHITPDVGAISFTPRVRPQVPCSTRPWRLHKARWREVAVCLGVILCVRVPHGAGEFERRHEGYPLANAGR
jgi:hypothetical protein